MHQMNCQHQTVPVLDPLSDEAWEKQPTALEAARYSEALKLQADGEARRKAAAAEGAKMLFGKCLMQLVSLGVRENQARAMLGKWRSKAKDDDLLTRIIDHAHQKGTPDPVGYVTKAIEKVNARTDTTNKMMKGEWELLGWEAPRRTASGLKWFGPERGQVWRDPYGKNKVLPAPDGIVPPSLDVDAGIEA